jgi:hypothetical protein
MPDLINGLFELIGGLLIWLNVFKLYIDKQIRGVHYAPMVFFMLWGYWNLYYYAHLDQWISWAAGINIVTANTVWVCQLVYFWRKYDVKTISS